MENDKMSNKETYKINVIPKWVDLIEEFSIIIQNCTLKLDTPKLSAKEYQSARDSIINAEKELKKIANIADILNDAFVKGKTHVTFYKDKDDKIKSSSGCSVCYCKFGFATVEGKDYCENCINTLEE